MYDWDKVEKDFYTIKKYYEEIPEGKLALVLFLNPIAKGDDRV